MDNLPGFITANLPPQLLAHLSRHSSSYWKAYRTAVAARDAAVSHAAPLLQSLRQLNPDLASFLLLALLLLLALKILDMLRSAVMFWLRLAYRLVLYGSLIGLAAWVWARGLDGALDDAHHALDWVVVYWQDSYRRYQRQEEVARLAQEFARRQGVGGGGAGGGGWFGQ